MVRKSVKPIKTTTSVIADRLIIALLLSVMYCQRGIKAITTSVLTCVLGGLGLKAPTPLELLDLNGISAEILLLNRELLARGRSEFFQWDHLTIRSGLFIHFASMVLAGSAVVFEG